MGPQPVDLKFLVSLLEFNDFPAHHQSILRISGGTLSNGGSREDEYLRALVSMLQLEIEDGCDADLLSRRRD